MAILHGRSAAPPTVSVPAPVDVVRRLWRLPLRAHVAALAAVLVALVPVIGTGASFSADEGAAIIQARSLSRGDGWIVEHPLAEVDPAGRQYPLELSARGPDGVAPFAKHPLYALVLAALDRLGGVGAMVALSLAGTVAAAAVAGLLARRLDPVLAVPAVWVTGIASPLAFDGYVVIAHTLGAAAAGGAALAALVALERRRWPPAAGAAGLVALAVLLRTEATLYALALAGVLAMVGLARRRQAGAALMPLVTAAAVGAAAVVARLGEAAWARAIVGGPVGGTGGGPDVAVGFLAGKVRAFFLTWIRPSYGDQAFGVEIALVMMAASLALAAFVARRYPGDGEAFRSLSLVAAVSAVTALAAGPANLVPGLLVAFPVGLAGLLVLGRSALATTDARVLAGVAGAFTLAVLATQYPSGGSGEWGGRYFALVLPLAVPVLLLALERRAGDLAPACAPIAVGALALCTLCLTIMAVLSIRETHGFTADLIAAVDQVAAESGHDEPVIVTAEPALPRLAWGTFERQRWLLVQEDEVAETVSRLEAAGLGPVVVVGQGDVVPPGSTVTTATRAAQWEVALLA